MEQLRLFLRDKYGDGILTSVGTFHHCIAFDYKTISGKHRKHLFVKNLEPEYLTRLQEEERSRTIAQIEQLTHTYRLKLSGCGVRVPGVYQTHQVNQQGCWVIEVSGNCGTSAGKILETVSPQAQCEVIAKILQQIIPVLEEDDLGIDPHPQNFVLNSIGETFVDFVPVHYRDGEVTLTGYPPIQDPVWLEYLTKRYFSPFGILRILRFNLMRIHPDLEEAFYQQAARLVPNWGDIASAFRELPERHFTGLMASRDTSGAHELIDSLNQFEVDSLREIAFRLLPNNPYRLSELFELTQLDFRLGESTRAERLEQFKRKLQNLIETN